MRRILLLIFLIFLLISCSSLELVPKALASETQKVVEQVERDSDAVFYEIQHNIDLVNDLKAKVETAKIRGESLSLDEVIKDIQTVSQSYDKLSNDHEGIQRSLLKKIARIEELQDKVDEEINALRERRIDYTEQFRAVNDPNPDNVRTRQKSLEQAIKYVDSQITLWENFNAIEADIALEMVNVEKTIDSFLSVIDSSAILFREGLNLLVLQRDINNALSLFTQDLPRMEQLTKDMEKSWANLDYLVENLTSMSIAPIRAR